MQTVKSRRENYINFPFDREFRATFATLTTTNEARRREIENTWLGERFYATVGLPLRLRPTKFNANLHILLVAVENYFQTSSVSK